MDFIDSINDSNVAFKSVGGRIIAKGVTKTALAPIGSFYRAAAAFISVLIFLFAVCRINTRQYLRSCFLLVL